ncbi:MAG: flagellar biosynthetic protein FliR [Rhodocyclaceae bacterium]
MDVAWALGVFLVGVRIAVALLLTPPFYHTNIPISVRALLVLSIAFVMACAHHIDGLAATFDTPSIVCAVIREAIVGLSLGLGIHVAFAAFALGGRLIDVQVGFGIGQVFDPVTRQQIPILTTLLNLCAVILFFTAEFHHVLFRGLFESLVAVPVSAPNVTSLFFLPQARQLASMMTLGFALVAPVVICLLMVEAAVGVIARSLQRVNLFIFSIPVRVAVGLGAMALWIVAAAPTIRRIYESIFVVWGEAFR